MPSSGGPLDAAKPATPSEKSQHFRGQLLTNPVSHWPLSFSDHAGRLLIQKGRMNPISAEVRRKGYY
jgi:hypothetical protein